MTNKNSLTQIVHYQDLHFIQFSQVGKLLVITYCTSLKATTLYQALLILYIIEKYWNIKRKSTK